MKKLQDIALNSDMLNRLIDKKLAVFQIFVVKDEQKKNYSLNIKDKESTFEIQLAEFKTYQQYLRWLTEAAIMRTAASSQQVKKVRSIYKKMFFAARDPLRINPLQKEE